MKVAQCYTKKTFDNFDVLVCIEHRKGATQ